MCDSRFPVPMHLIYGHKAEVNRCMALAALNSLKITASGPHIGFKLSTYTRSGVLNMALAAYTLDADWASNCQPSLRLRIVYLCQIHSDDDCGSRRTPRLRSQNIP